MIKLSPVAVLTVQGFSLATLDRLDVTHAIGDAEALGRARWSKMFKAHMKAVRSFQVGA